MDVWCVLLISVWWAHCLDPYIHLSVTDSCLLGGVWFYFILYWTVVCWRVDRWNNVCAPYRPNDLIPMQSTANRLWSDQLHLSTPVWQRPSVSVLESTPPFVCDFAFLCKCVFFSDCISIIAYTVSGAADTSVLLIKLKSLSEEVCLCTCYSHKVHSCCTEQPSEVVGTSPLPEKTYMYSLQVYKCNCVLV